MPTFSFLLSLSVALVALPAQAGPHEHGLAHLNVAIDGQQVQASFKIPMESLLGYERAPQSPQERAQVKALLDQLQQTRHLMQVDAQARCQGPAPTVKAPVLEGKATSEHGDIEIEWQLQCAQPALLRKAEVTLFELAPRLRRVQAQVAGPQGQTRTMLRRNLRELPLQRPSP
jgi:hypothetical protein